jgi:hypothetical protein
MRLSVVVVSVVAYLVAAGPALAANQRDWNDCKAGDPDRSIAGRASVPKT